MNISVMEISIITGVAVFFVFFAIITLIDDRKRKMAVAYDPDDWFLKHINDTVYDIVFGKMSPEKAAKSMGVDMVKYNNAVYVAGIDGRLKGIVICRLYALLLFLVATIILFFGGTYASLIILLFSCYLFMEPFNKIQKEAERRVQRIESELPRYVDLLETALQIQMPVEQAIIITAQKVPCELSREILMVMEQARLASASWTDAFETLSTKYNIQAFTDLIFNMVIASRKGVDIYEVVKKKSEDVKAAHLINLRDSAKKADAMVMMSIMGLKFLPIIVILLIPAILQMSSAFSF